MTPKLSIITPCLNAKKTIRDTIESVLQQGLDDIEYIIIDGGSNDGTLDIINEYADTIDVIVSEPDRGISDAFNKGVTLAKGDYIGIVNADDYYEPNALEAILSTALEHHRPDIIHGSLRYVTPEEGEYVEHPNMEHIWRYMSAFHPTMFIHRTAYESIGMYRLDFHYAMDSEWVHRALSNGLTFAQSQQVISNMRLGGVSHKNMRQSLLEFRRSVILHRKYRFLSSYCFIRQLIIQTMIKIPWVKKQRLQKRPPEMNKHYP